MWYGLQNLTSGQSNLTKRRHRCRTCTVQSYSRDGARVHQCVLLWAHLNSQPKRHLDRFSRFCTTHDTMSSGMSGQALPHQNCPFPWGMWTPSNTWFVALNRVHNPNGISIGSAVSAGLVTMTDRPRYSVCNSRLHLLLCSLKRITWSWLCYFSSQTSACCGLPMY